MNKNLPGRTPIYINGVLNCNSLGASTKFGVVICFILVSLTLFWFLSAQSNKFVYCYFSFLFCRIVTQSNKFVYCLFFFFVLQDCNICNYFEWHYIEFTPRSKSVINELLDFNRRLKNEVAMHKMIPKWDCDRLLFGSKCR